MATGCIDDMRTYLTAELRAPRWGIEKEVEFIKLTLQYLQPDQVVGKRENLERLRGILAAIGCPVHKHFDANLKKAIDYGPQYNVGAVSEARQRVEAELRANGDDVSKLHHYEPEPEPKKTQQAAKPTPQKSLF